MYVEECSAPWHQVLPPLLDTDLDMRRSIVALASHRTSTGINPGTTLARGTTYDEAWSQQAQLRGYSNLGL